ncbi:MAG: hypothetical protein ACOYJ1_07795 [Peptococcales bacterium]|jgi:hypothetical protein
MGFFDDEVAKIRMEKALKEFENLRKPTKRITKMDLVNSFKKGENSYY